MTEDALRMKLEICEPRKMVVVFVEATPLRAARTLDGLASPTLGLPQKRKPAPIPPCSTLK